MQIRLIYTDRQGSALLYIWLHLIKESMVKVCQMLSRWTRKLPHSINNWDLVTKAIPLCSGYWALSYEPNTTLLAPFSTELAYFSMLFTTFVTVSQILMEWGKSFTITGINNMIKKAKFGRNYDRKVKLGSCDGTWYTERNGTTFVTVSQILMEWGKSFVHQDNIWQSVDWSCYDL